MTIGVKRIKIPPENGPQRVRQKGPEPAFIRYSSARASTTCWALTEAGSSIRARLAHLRASSSSPNFHSTPNPSSTSAHFSSRWTSHYNIKLLSECQVVLFTKSQSFHPKSSTLINRTSGVAGLGASFFAVPLVDEDQRTKL